MIGQKINIDSNLLTEYAQELLNLVDDYNSLIYAIYNELYNISNNGIWTGNGANNWIFSLKNDRDCCILLGKMLYNYGNSMISLSNNIESELKRCDIDG